MSINKKIRLTESQLRYIIKESINSTVKLYRCYNDNLVTSNWKWMPDYPDNQYGKNVAVFNIPLNQFKIADMETVISYIKRYDITCFEDAYDDEYIDRWIGINLMMHRRHIIIYL